MVLGISSNYAAVLLSRLADKKSVVHLTRGKWAYSDYGSILPAYFGSVNQQMLIYGSKHV